MAEKLEKPEQEPKYSNSAIAHELRTPLTSLRGRLQGLADGVYDPNPNLFYGLISHVEGLTRIVDDLKTLSLMNAGKIELQLSEFELASEVDDVAKSIAPTLSSAELSLGVDAQITWVLAIASASGRFCSP